MLLFAAATAELVSCPGDLHAVMNSANGRMDVQYELPVFVDDQNQTLQFSCSPDQAFAVGSTQVTCLPMMSQSTPFNVKCQFNVVITGAPYRIIAST